MIRSVALAAAALAVTATPAAAELPSLTDAFSFAFSGLAVAIGIVVLGFFLFRKHFKERPVVALIAGVFMFLWFVHIGGMDWFTYGEYQGGSPEKSDGDRWQYTPGSGWEQ